MERPVIVGLGEILWDQLPSGPRFGGAPANFACAAARLFGDTATVHLVSAVGRDDLGTDAVAELQRRGVGIEHVEKTAWPTGEVQVLVDDDGVPTYRFDEGQAWDHLSWRPALARLAETCQAVCFGTLGQRCEPSRVVIERFTTAAKRALRVFDINIREPYFSTSIAFSGLQIANVVKLNEEELVRVAAMTGVSGDGWEMAKQIRQRLQLVCLAVTRGPKGAWLFSEEGASDVPAPQVEVTHTVGAGDAFTAALVQGLLRRDPLDAINRHAVAVAAAACSGE
jgi:fructokinase